MGKRVSRTKQGAPPARPAGASGSRMGPIAIIGVLVVVVLVGALLFWPSGSSPAGTASAGATAGNNAAPASDVSRQIAENAAAKAALGPHKQASYPPIPFQSYAPPRSPEVVTAAYQFAAEHPEISSYVPCFCGCENAGHQGNTDCFVKSRAANGDVLEWEEHGVDCAVCIDVATRCRQMYSSGASVRDIRSAIDKEFGAIAPSKMPTPQPPAPHATH